MADHDSERDAVEGHGDGVASHTMPAPPPEHPLAGLVPSIPRAPAALSIADIPGASLIEGVAEGGGGTVVRALQSPQAQEAVSIAREVESVASAARDLGRGIGLSSVARVASSGLDAAAAIPGLPGETLHAVASGIDTARASIEAVRSVVHGAGALLHKITGSDHPLPEVSFDFTSSSGAWRVAKVRADEALSETWEAKVDLVTDDLLDDPDAMLGQPATLSLSRSASARIFRGVVRRVEHLGMAHGRLLARVYVVPALWALSQRINSRVFHDVAVIDVIRAVLHDAGLYEGRLDAALRDTYLQREYCVQYRESDLAFIQRLMEEEGITYYFKHALDGETLVLTDHDCYQTIATLDGQAVPVAGAESDVLAMESVRQLDWEREQRPTAVMVRDYDFTRPQVPISQQVPREAGARPVYEYPAEAVFSDYSHDTAQHHDDNVDRLAQIRLQALRASEQQGTGPSNVTGMTPGFAFTLRAHGRAALNQRYLITRVTHEGNAPEALSHGTQHTGDSKERYKNTVTCIPASVPWRPMRLTPRPQVTGIQTATVVGPAGREIYTDSHGRIKVRFHWDRRDESRDPDTLRWVRVAQAWGGGTWGLVVTPRIGMEVVVQFIEGNPDRPLVTGCVYNNRNRPAVDHPHASSQTRLRSNSTPGGNGFNELSFEDAAGSELFYMHAQRDHQEDVLHDQRITVGNDRTVRVTGTQLHAVKGDRISRIGDDGAVSCDESVITGWKTVDAGLGIALQCGGSRIEMTPDYIVVRTGGTSVSLDGHTIKISASTAVYVNGADVFLNCDVPADAPSSSPVASGGGAGGGGGGFEGGGGGEFGGGGASGSW